MSIETVYKFKGYLKEDYTNDSGTTSGLTLSKGTECLITFFGNQVIAIRDGRSTKVRIPFNLMDIEIYSEQVDTDHVFIDLLKKSAVFSYEEAVKVKEKTFII